MIGPRETLPVTDEILNAYVDGALTRDEAAQIAQRAATDPATARRIALLHRLKADVAGIADDVVMIDMPVRAMPAAQRRLVALALGALAATLLLAAPAFWYGQSGGRSGATATDLSLAAGTDAALAQLVARHDAWLSRADQAAAPGSLGYWLDDLMATTGLRLVHQALLPVDGADQSRQFAFAGPNGCRLSLFEVALPSVRSVPLEISISDGLLTAGWALEGRGYALVARNMDPARFTTISAFVHDASRNRASADAQALASLQQARRPCLG